MKFKIIYFDYITPIEKSLKNGNENMVLLLLTVGRVDVDVEKLFKLQMRTIKTLFNCAGYNLTSINKISIQQEKKESDNYQENHHSKSLPNKESQNIHQILKEMKEKQPNETSKDKNDINKKQIIESLKHFQSEIFDTESSKYLEKIEEIGQSQHNKFTKVLMKKIYTLKEIKEEKSKSNSQNIQRLIDEFDIMLTLHHQNILKVHGQFTNVENQTNPSILLEYCPFNLEQKIKKENLSKVEQVYWIYQIAEGMKYIHSRKIVHNNLKPSNIFVSERGTIKIGDFEKARINESNSETGKMEDVYAFGFIVHFILFGDQNANEKSITILARQLIEACLSDQPECRPTFEMICEVMENNDFNLISLSQQEIQEIQKLISQHKSLITSNSEFYG